MLTLGVAIVRLEGRLAVIAFAGNLFVKLFGGILALVQLEFVASRRFLSAARGLAVGLIPPAVVESTARFLPIALSLSSSRTRLQLAAVGRLRERDADVFDEHGPVAHIEQLDSHLIKAECLVRADKDSLLGCVFQLCELGALRFSR